jgi:hypothetical protein
VKCRCGAQFGAGAHLAGKTVKCPKCQQPLQIPAAASAPAAAAPAPAAKPAAAPAPAAAPRPATTFDELFDELGIKQKATGDLACPGCGEELAPEAVICVHCGYDRRTGKKLETTTTKSVPVKQLGAPPTKGKGKRRGYSSSGSDRGSAAAIPWEESGGSFGAILPTVLRVLLSPAETFREMIPNGGLSEPIMFASAVNLVIQIVFMGLQMIASMAQGQGSIGAMAAGAACAMLLVPVFTSLQLFIGAGICHLGLLMLGAAKEGYRATFRVYGYCAGACSAVQLTCVGILLIPILLLYTQTVGFREVHQTSTGKAFFGAVMPLLVSALLCFAAFLAFGAALSAAIEAARQAQAQ